MAPDLGRVSGRVARLTAAGVDALPVRAQFWARSAARRVVPRARRVVGSLTSPLVSVVLPVYDVAAYLPACLDSLLGQSHRRIEVIAVDDGSPDDSITILQDYAARDPRVRILRQPNAGLGAARNAGVAKARGTFVMFVDSDDVVLPGTVAAYVRSLRRTGSDFAVSAYQRLDDAGAVPAAAWVRAVHRRNRPRTTLAAYPEIQVNAVAWSKCYRRSFWRAAGLRFPEGVTYEDQPVSARAYARARSFDVLAKLTHQWRIRSDRSSITQQMSEVADLRSRFVAADASLAELRSAGADAAYDVRLAQLLSHNFSRSIRAAQHADDAFWAELTAGLQRLTAQAGPAAWDRVAAQHRISIRLVVAGRRAEVVDFVGLGHANPAHVPAVVARGRVHAQFGPRAALGLTALDPLLALADDQLELTTVTRRLAWRPDGSLEIGGWAYITHLDLAGEAQPVQLRLVRLGLSRATPETIELAVSPGPDAWALAGASTHRYADYRPGLFVAVVDPATLPGQGRWAVEVTVRAHGLTRTGRLRRPQAVGSAGRLAGRVLPESGAGGRRLTPAYDGADGLVLTVEPAPVVARAIQVTGRQVRVELLGPGPPLRHDLAVGPGPVRVRRPDGRQAGIGVPLDLVLPDCWPRLELDAAGDLVVDDEPVLLVDAVRVSGHTLEIRARLSGPPTVSARTLALRSASHGCAGELTATADGDLLAVLELVDDPWGRGPRPLAVGRYRWEADLAGLDLEALDLEGTELAVRPTEDLLAALPMTIATPHLRGELQRDRGGLALVLEAPLGPDERGPRAQQRHRDALAARFEAADPTVEVGAVLLRSYYGEICGCNPAAVHHELRRRGTAHTLYWAVRDHSVAVPEGGVAVLYESAEWYRLLHEAEYYLDNMHQAIYHRKPPHQTQVQFFHGYPFKEMGRSHWRRQRRDLAHVASYLQRAADWDQLVSPARYGTEPLRTEFGFPGEPLQIGYPRNDVLVGPDADSIRRGVRELLGIRPEQTTVLYAPTFRDQLARGDFRAVMVDFLDLDQLSTILGPEFVIMVRGHAFNARQQERYGSRGQVVDVTDHPDVAELCLASDAAVLDYSSLRFDYGLTGKPMVFCVPDLQAYLGQARGSIGPFEPTAPGPLLQTTAEVAAALADLDEVRRAHAAAYARFRSDFLDLDDGHAAARLVDRVFGD